MPVITGAGTQGIETSHWVAWADEDYLAARLLLLSGHVVQGTALASTAVEKYLKAVCTLSGIPFRNVGHNVSKLNGLLHNRAIRLELNTDFLKLLNKAYKLRYPDELAEGFNVALNSIAVLAALDVTVERIRRGFQFVRNGEVTTTRLDHARKSQSPELLTKNCAFGNASKEQLFAEPSWCYEVRVFPHRGIMEVSYVVEKLPDQDNLRRNAFTPISGSEERSFNLAWLPMQGTAS
jgi:HEPN domain-containing protein